MRPFPILAAVFTTVLVASAAHAESRLDDSLVLVLAACLATALVAFSWWELWSSRHER
jgi:hypothetical protein